MEYILGFTHTMFSLANAIWFGSYFVWGIGFYLLFKLYHLKFLKVLIWAEVTGGLSWFWINRPYFAPNLMAVTEYSTDTDIATLAILDMIFHLTPILVGTIGAIMGLMHIQNIWKEKQAANQELEPTRTTPDELGNN